MPGSARPRSRPTSSPPTSGPSRTPSRRPSRKAPRAISSTGSRSPRPWVRGSRSSPRASSTVAAKPTDRTGFFGGTAGASRGFRRVGYAAARLTHPTGASAAADLSHKKLGTHAVFGGFGAWQTVIEPLNRWHGRAGPVMSARLCASYGKHGDKDSIPFGFPVGLI